VINDPLAFEADSAELLSRCLQGLGIRVAKAINRLEGARGKVFAERYRQDVLRAKAISSRAKELLVGNCGTLAVSKNRGIRLLAKG